MDINISTIPNLPGVYLLKGSKDKILYIGKAKNLKNRLKTYFQNSSSLDTRKKKLVRIIKDYSYIVTSNELEALILEANLIKKYKPKFNIILRDDKNYPYIRLSITEKWPKIEVVRGLKRDGNLYFGPYIPAQSVWNVLDFIRRNFLIRTCKQSLDKNKKRPCVQYQMKKCVAPCSGKVSQEDYLKMIEDVQLFLSGEKNELIEKLEKKMFTLSEQTRYEEAAKIRDKIKNIKKAFNSQKIISPELNDLDVIGYYKESDKIAIEILFVRNGFLIGAKEFFIDSLIIDRENEIIHSILSNFYSKEIEIPPLILTNCFPKGKSFILKWLKERSRHNVLIEIPKNGKKFELLKMANENAKIFFIAKTKSSEKILENLKNTFLLKKVPHTIGAFDISTVQGKDSVGAYIFLENGNFKKENYRHFKIKTVTSIDDYSMLTEIVERTFSKNETLIPNLLIVDGGKAQLNTVKKVLDNLNIGIDLISIAKKPDRVFTLNDKIIPLDDKSALSSFLKRIRDEVHRFAISYHRKIRSKKLLSSPLESIPLIGKKRRLALLKHFGNIDNIRNASVEEIAKIKGFNSKIAEKLIENLKN
ncbi:MAG: excinuclease ABC subunit UvrC [Thermodesulfovibrionales bacterium]|nr:excinuclease ABC subunit UvrC [Thermodesulfovibrionales bacterium]